MNITTEELIALVTAIDFCEANLNDAVPEDVKIVEKLKELHAKLAKKYDLSNLDAPSSG